MSNPSWRCVVLLQVLVQTRRRCRARKTTDGAGRRDTGSGALGRCSLGGVRWAGDWIALGRTLARDRCQRLQQHLVDRLDGHDRGVDLHEQYDRHDRHDDCRHHHDHARVDNHRPGNHDDDSGDDNHDTATVQAWMGLRRQEPLSLRLARTEQTQQRLGARSTDRLLRHPDARSPVSTCGSTYIHQNRRYGSSC